MGGSLPEKRLEKEKRNALLLPILNSQTAVILILEKGTLPAAPFGGEKVSLGQGKNDSLAG